MLNSKYLPVWKRLRAKIKAKSFVQQLDSNIKLFGTTKLVDSNMNLMKKNTIKGIFNREEVVPILIFHPNSKSKSMWNIVMAILLLYTATIMPYKIAFIDIEKWSTWFYFDLVMDSLFF